MAHTPKIVRIRIKKLQKIVRSSTCKVSVMVAKYKLKDLNEKFELIGKKNKKMGCATDGEKKWSKYFRRTDPLREIIKEYRK